MKKAEQPQVPQIGEVWISPPSCVSGSLVVLGVDVEQDLVIVVPITQMSAQRLSKLMESHSRTAFRMALRTSYLIKLMRDREQKAEKKNPDGVKRPKKGPKPGKSKVTGPKAHGEGSAPGKYDSIIKTACTDGWMTVKAMQTGSEVLRKLPPSALSTKCLKMCKAGVLERRKRSSPPTSLVWWTEYEYRLREEGKEEGKP